MDDEKRSSYSPEEKEKVSPGPPVHGWGNGSYDAITGRAARVADKRGPSGNQISSAGRHTTSKAGKSSRPGRW